MSSIAEQILRPVPRRMFELTPASTESSVPPSPAAESTNPELLETKPEASYTPSKTRSILNLTSSTLLGIYSPTGYEANREDTSTPWGTGAQTPSHRKSVDDSGPPLASESWEPPISRTEVIRRKGGFRHYYLPLFLRGLSLFVFGMAYGTIVTHLHDHQELAPVKVEGFSRQSWSYLILWGISGIAMGSLLPWVDSAWENRFESKPPVQTQHRQRRVSSLAPDNHDDERSSGRFNNGLGADWNPVVRSIGAFVGIAFAIVSALSLLGCLRTDDRFVEKAPLAVYATGLTHPGSCKSGFVVPDRSVEDRILTVHCRGGGRHSCTARHQPGHRTITGCAIDQGTACRKEFFVRQSSLSFAYR